MLSALRRVGLPALATQTQPADKTLVNFDTIFFTEPRDVSLTLTILGQAVDVVATPVSYRWHFGDGASQEGSDPGAEYPDLRITHVYAKAGVTVSPSVDVTYQGRYRVDGGDWVQIPDTLTVAGTPVDLEVLSATPHLVG